MYSANMETRMSKDLVEQSVKVRQLEKWLIMFMYNEWHSHTWLNLNILPRALSCLNLSKHGSMCYSSVG